MSSNHLRLVAAMLVASASVTVGASSAWAGPPPTTATPEQSAEATKAYSAGVDHFKAGRLAEALAQFRASYAAVASPNSHLMIARVLRDQGAIVEAYREYRATQREAAALVPAEAKYQTAADGATQALTELSAQVGLVTVRVQGPPLVDLAVADRKLEDGELGTAVPVAPGTISVTGRSADGRAVSKSVEVAAGAAVEVSLELEAAPAPKPIGPVAPPPEPDTSISATVPIGIASAVVGAAGFALFGAFGAMNDATYSDLEAACPGDVCGPGAQQLIDDGRTQQLVANIGLGVGSVGMAAAATCLIVGLATSGSDGAPPDVALSIGPTGAVLQGTF